MSPCLGKSCLFGLGNCYSDDYIARGEGEGDGGHKHILLDPKPCPLLLQCSKHFVCMKVS